MGFDDLLDCIDRPSQVAYPYCRSACGDSRHNYRTWKALSLTGAGFVLADVARHRTARGLLLGLDILAYWLAVSIGAVVDWRLRPRIQSRSNTVTS